MSKKHIKGGLQPHEGFGVVVAAWRVALGLTQEQLGERCDLDRTYISGIERRLRNPTIQVIWIIAPGLETTPSRLLAAVEDLLATPERSAGEIISRYLAG